MHAGKNMGIMTTLEKNLLQKAPQGESARDRERGRTACHCPSAAFLPP